LFFKKNKDFLGESKGFLGWTTNKRYNGNMLDLYYFVLCIEHLFVKGAERSRSS